MANRTATQTQAVAVEPLNWEAPAPASGTPLRIIPPAGDPSTLPPNSLRTEVAQTAWLPAEPREPSRAEESADSRTPFPDAASEVLLALPEPPTSAVQQLAPPGLTPQDPQPTPSASDLPASPPSPIMPIPESDTTNPFERDRSQLRSMMEPEQSFSGPVPERGIYTDCDELREKVVQRTIEKISLDISPPFRPDLLDEDEARKEYEKFLAQQPIRPWRDTSGKLLANGRFRNLSYERLIIETEDGDTLQFPLSEISEPDLAYITTAWGLPRVCLLEREQYAGRAWIPTTMTWKASALCHKPLYFEEVELERYGHSLGPFAQPVCSTAHFFLNIAVLPYKMGMHTPCECQYALGYYRPGNCAPWIVPPVPLSLRGAISQAAAVGVGVALLP